MKQGSITPKTRAACCASVLALTLAAAPALAQSASDFRLPPASSSATPRAQGPVDADHPDVVRAAPSIAPAPVATQIIPSPTASASSAAAAPARRPAASAPPAARSAAQQRATPAAAAPSPAPSATETTPPAPALERGVLASPLAPLDAVRVPLTGADGATGGLAWQAWAALGGIAALLLALVLWTMRRRRRPALASFEADDSEAEAAAIPEPAPLPEPTPEPEPETTPDLPDLAPAALADSGDASGLNLTFEALRMTATLVTATLSYQVTLTNGGDRPVGPISVGGGMIGAHASLSPEQQLALDGQPLEVLQDVPGIAPGESVSFRGDLRVPLSEILPVHAGHATFFVPLVRFRAECAGMWFLACYVVGEEERTPGARLRPFRLDLGPRMWSNLSLRMVQPHG